MSAVGIYLGAQGATVAVLRRHDQEWRLCAVAEVGWPDGGAWGHGAPGLLRRARRRLCLSGLQPAAVTLPAADAGGVAAAAVLLARAGFVQCWTTGTPAAGHAGAATADRADPGVRLAATRTSVRLAAGAAALALGTPPPGSTTRRTAVAADPATAPNLTGTSPAAGPVVVARTTGTRSRPVLGWAVERIAAPHPPGITARRHRVTPARTTEGDS